MKNLSKDQLIPLWPTWIGQTVLPLAEHQNIELLDLAQNLTNPGNLFDAEHLSVKWLKGHVQNALSQWFERMHVNPSLPTKLHGRIDTLSFGQYRELNNAPGAYLSGIYFVNTPEGPMIDHLRSDGFPSHFSLLDPRVGFNAQALVGDANFNEACTIKPVAGTLMIWPAYLRHCSRVHLSTMPWVRVLLRIELDQDLDGSKNA